EARAYTCGSKCAARTAIWRYAWSRPAHLADPTPVSGQNTTTTPNNRHRDAVRRKMYMSLIQDGNADAPVHILLAHGAGAPATSRFLSALSELLAKRGLRVSRFNFAYMAAFVESGKRRPPPRIPVLEEEYLAFVREVAAATPRMRLVIGGKSMGGRVASLIADRLHGEGLISGLVCLGYPF